jgi:hypothetical protein
VGKEDLGKEDPGKEDLGKEDRVQAREMTTMTTTTITTTSQSARERERERRKRLDIIFVSCSVTHRSIHVYSLLETHTGVTHSPLCTDLDVVNLAFDQPFSEFFVMVHDETVEPIFTLGDEPFESLAILAEDGSTYIFSFSEQQQHQKQSEQINLSRFFLSLPSLSCHTDATALVLDYEGTAGVLSAEVFSEGAPFVLGQEVTIPVWVNKFYQYVTIAAMAINTNDAFVAINGMALVPGDRVTSVGYDAGSEENNENCDSIPGPACDATTGNAVSGNGEGFVHVSRGIHGIEDLAPEQYDWRNPMMLVNVA